MPQKWAQPSHCILTKNAINFRTEHWKLKSSKVYKYIKQVLIRCNSWEVKYVKLFANIFRYQLEHTYRFNLFFCQPYETFTFLVPHQLFKISLPENWTSALTLVMLNKLRSHIHFNFQPIRLLDQGCWYRFTYWMTNSADPDQLASSEANWSGSILFAKTGYIRVQQDKG